MSSEYPRVHGATLRYWRFCAGLSQRELAEAAARAAESGIGRAVQPSQVAQIELGRHQPRPRSVAAIAAALGKTPEDLYGPPPDPEPEPPAADAAGAAS